MTVERSASAADGDGSNEDRPKWRDELYHLARAAHKAEIDRFDEAEKKAFRYTTLIFAILGASSFGLAELADTLACPHTFVEGALALAYLGFCVTTIVAGGLALSALKVGRVRTLAVSRQMEERFGGKGYAYAIESLTRQYITATECTRKIVYRKYRCLKSGYWALVVSFIFAVVSGATYLVAQMTEDQMNRHDDPNAPAELIDEPRPNGPDKEDDEETQSDDSDFEWTERKLPEDDVEKK